MSWMVLVILLVALAAVVSVAALWAFLRVTAGASSLRERVDRLFVLRRRARPLEPEHYFKAYWERR